MDSGGYGDIWTWVLDEDVHEKVFRVSLDGTCVLVRFVQLIAMPNGDVLIGMRERSDKSGVLFFRLLSGLQFAYCPEDQQEQE